MNQIMTFKTFLKVWFLMKKNKVVKNNKHKHYVWKEIVHLQLMNTSSKNESFIADQN